MFFESCLILLMEVSSYILGYMIGGDSERAKMTYENTYLHRQYLSMRSEARDCQRKQGNLPIPQWPDDPVPPPRVGLPSREVTQ